MKTTIAILTLLLLGLPAVALDLEGAALDGRLSYFNPTEASNTFDANFSGGKALTFGAGGTWSFSNGLYLEGALDYYKKSGNKVYTGGGSTRSSGFGTDISILPITATAGWTFLKEAPASVLVGGGIGYYLVNVTDGNADNSFGYHLVAGTEFLKDRAFGMAVELKLSRVPNALGHSGTSALFGEDDVGGITLTVKGLWRYRD